MIRLRFSSRAVYHGSRCVYLIGSACVGLDDIHAPVDAGNFHHHGTVARAWQQCRAGREWPIKPYPRITMIRYDDTRFNFLGYGMIPISQPRAPARDPKTARPRREESAV
jgi:hypothetical protein